MRTIFNTRIWGDIHLCEMGEDISCPRGNEDGSTNHLLLDRWESKRFVIKLVGELSRTSDGRHKMRSLLKECEQGSNLSRMTDSMVAEALSKALLRRWPVLYRCVITAAQSAGTAISDSETEAVRVRQMQNSTSSKTLSWYEVALVDETEQPIAGIDLAITTPEGPCVKPTSAGGIVRLDNIPRGNATACIASLEQFAKATQSWENKPRRKQKLPKPTPLYAITTPTRATASVTFPDAQRMTIMVVTRTDMNHATHSPGFTKLSVAPGATGPWKVNFAQNRGEVQTISLHSNAQQLACKVIGQAPTASQAPSAIPVPQRLPIPSMGSSISDFLGSDLSGVAGEVLSQAESAVSGLSNLVSSAEAVAGDFASSLNNGSAANGNWPTISSFQWPSMPAPDGDPTHRYSADIDKLHDALFDKDYDTATDILLQMMEPPPVPPVPDWPSPDGEAALIHNELVRLAQQGLWDPSAPDDPEDAGSVDPVPAIADSSDGTDTDSGE